MALVFGVFFGLTNSFVVATIAVSFAYGILLIPFINFMCNVAEGRGNLEDIFQKDQYSLSNVLIGFIFSALVIFGTVLFIIPAFVFMTFFVLSLPISSNTTSKCFDSFLKAKDLSKGFRGRILSVLLIYFIIFAICVGLGIGLSALILHLIFNMFGWWIIGATIGIIMFLIFFLPYFVLSIVYLYDNTIAEKKEGQKEQQFLTHTEEDKEVDQNKNDVDETQHITKEDKDDKNPFDYSDVIRY